MPRRRKTLSELRQRALNAINRDEAFIYDVAAETGQIVDNVKHMQWFRDAVAQHLIDNFDQWMHLELED